MDSMGDLPRAHQHSAEAGALQPTIGDYALIGDCHSAALVSTGGSIDWCCFHRFDQRAVFNRMLDYARGGYFLVRPAENAAVSRRYRPETNILETRFSTARGVAVVTDAFAISEGGDPTEMPPMQLLRIVRCEAGVIDLDVAFKPRFDYGLTVPRIHPIDAGRFVAHGGADALVIESDVELREHAEASLSARVTLAAGEARFVAVTSVEPHRVATTRLGGAEVARRIDAAERFWRSWSQRCAYTGPYRDAVVRSALVLKALTNGPTGAIVAAPTTSLPEAPGGVRNWDYRYTWLRDAALHLEGLFCIGYADEARAFMRWLERTTAGRAADLQVLYGVGGERLVPEIELSALQGYRGARPVRIGNHAAEQLQLDVYGHLVETAHLYHLHGGVIDEELWRFLAEIVEVVHARWREPDHGIWEVRSEPEHFVTSKVMAWTAVDRAIRLAEALALPVDLDGWHELRSDIGDDVLSRGVHPVGSYFTRTYGSDDVDAAAARIALSGIVPATDPRVLATLERIEVVLAEGPLVRRYSANDGLPGSEGAFVAASFWLVCALARAGLLDRARARFEEMLSFANDIGLLAEEIEPRTREQLGNFPQSFSHTGLIVAATTLAECSPRPADGESTRDRRDLLSTRGSGPAARGASGDDDAR